MPNWCQNVIYVSHENQDKMEALKEAILKQELCDHILPFPKELEDIESGGCTINGKPQTVWRVDAPKNCTMRERLDAPKIAIPEPEQRSLRKKYGCIAPCDWTRDNWGTKWDICSPNDTDEIYHADDGESQHVFKFDTAWSPPIPVYEEMERQGFRLLARYVEYGMGFFGHYKEGNDISGKLTDGLIVQDEHLQSEYA